MIYPINLTLNSIPTSTKIPDVNGENTYTLDFITSGIPLHALLITHIPLHDHTNSNISSFIQSLELASMGVYL